MTIKFMGSSSPLAKIVDVTVRQEPLNTTYGSIYESQLVIKGWVIHAMMWHADDRMPWPWPNSLEVYHNALEPEWGNQGACVPVILLLVSNGVFKTVTLDHGVQKSYHWISGLILTATSSEQFRRLGAFKIDSNDLNIGPLGPFKLFDLNVKRRLITIV